MALHHDSQKKPCLGSTRRYHLFCVRWFLGFGLVRSPPLVVLLRLVVGVCMGCARLFVPRALFSVLELVGSLLATPLFLWCVRLVLLVFPLLLCASLGYVLLRAPEKYVNYRNV